MEYQVRDRLSFSRFLGSIEDSIPDAMTLWLFREKLAKAGLIEKLFDRFDQHPCGQGLRGGGGQIIDASIVLVPSRLGAHQRGGSRSPPKCGRRTAMRAGPRKHSRSFFGYKNHVNAVAKHKLIRHMR